MLFRSIRNEVGYWDGRVFVPEGGAKSYAKDELPEFIDGRWGLDHNGDDPAQWSYRPTCYWLETFRVVAA